MIRFIGFAAVVAAVLVLLSALVGVGIASVIVGLLIVALVCLLLNQSGFKFHWPNEGTKALFGLVLIVLGLWILISVLSH